MKHGRTNNALGQFDFEMGGNDEYPAGYPYYADESGYYTPEPVSTFPESDFYTGVGDKNPQPLKDLYVSPGKGYDEQTVRDAAQAVRDGQSTNVRRADGSTVTVKALSAGSSLPSLPDAKTLYKIGQTLFRATGQFNPQGVPIYAQTPVQSNSMLMPLALAAGAFLLLS